MLDDRRSAFRRNAFTHGAISAAGSRVSCLVWDATEAGALIEVERPDGVPDRFDLCLSEGAAARPAAVAWRRGRRLGVTFAD